MSKGIDEALEQEEIGYGEVANSDPEAGKDTGTDIRRIIQEKVTEAADSKVFTSVQAKKLYDLLLNYLPAQTKCDTNVVSTAHEC